MTAVNGKTLIILSMILALAWCQQFQYDSEVPAVLSYNSPLRQPDSLRSRPYFDFLSTLYRRDADKSQLFRPYLRTRRSIVDNALPLADSQHTERSKRAIVFRPLFVYRQQELRRQKLQNQRRHRV
ncbi:limostatin [Cochliomyia hominivorax]